MEIKVRNPRTGKYDYTFRQTSDLEVKQKTKFLRNNQQEWENNGLSNRIEVLQRWKEVLLQHKDELIENLVEDTGRKNESIGEFQSTITLIDRLCRLAPEILHYNEPKHSSISHIKVTNDFKAYPVVGVISAWNFSLSTPFMDALPALIAGCSVIVKPSEITPRFVAVINKTIEQVPQLMKVLSFVNGGAETGVAITNNVDLICFTGSVPTGRKVAENAAKRFIPFILELGGKDPAIVTDTANIERATSAILFGSMRNAGQLCVSIERVFVAEQVFDQFVNLFVEKTKKLTLAYPSVDDGEIGPIIFADQAKIIEDQINDAKGKGAIVLCGGKIETLGGGIYVHPTVITNVSRDMKVMTEETFGPIVSITKFTTIEEAIKLANHTNYGLAAAVFAGTEEEAINIARSVNAGGISINDCGLTSRLIGEGEERTSFNDSGMGGSRSGANAILRFTRKKALFINELTTRSPWWYDV